MKKNVALILLIIVFSLSTQIYAKPSNIKIEKVINVPGSRTISPSISGEMNEGTVTIDVDRYNGYVYVEISDTYGGSSINEFVYINGQTTFDIDISELSDGDYTVTIQLSDGSLYVGEFSISNEN